MVGLEFGHAVMLLMWEPDMAYAARRSPSCPASGPWCRGLAARAKDLDTRPDQSRVFNDFGLLAFRGRPMGFVYICTDLSDLPNAWHLLRTV